ncbi:MAG: hypothetical protein ACJ0QV_05600, partial [Gammaproteobacteria bacterium]
KLAIILVGDRMDIHISIVSHKNNNDVSRLLLQLSKNITPKRVTITENTRDKPIIIPNSLKDFTQIIYNTKPKGFGENHNSALLSTKCKYIAIINPDVSIENISFNKLINSISKEVKFVTPRATCRDSKLINNFRPFPSVFSPIRNLFVKDNNTYNEEEIVADWISGMFIVTESKVFRQLDGFDEGYFLYYEDVDLCRRLMSYNFKCKVINTEKVIHEGAHLSKKNIRYTLIHIKSMFRYHKKFGI